MLLLAIDPGLRGCGVGLIDNGRVALGRYIANPGPKTLRGPMAWRYMAEELPRKLYIKDVAEVVIEQQQVYRGARGRIGDPSDLLELAGVVGAVTVAFSHLPVIGVLPRLWKGQVNADVMTHRIEFEQMTEEERATIEEHRSTLRHNVIDAIGLGLWWWEKRSRQ